MNVDTTFQPEISAKSRAEVKSLVSYIGDVWPQYIVPEDAAMVYPQLCLFVKDVLFYVVLNEYELDGFSKKIISMRRNIEPRSNYFTEDIGVLTRDLVMHLRNKMHVDCVKFQHQVIIKPEEICKKYSRRMLQSENGRVYEKVKDWIRFRTRKHYMNLGSLTLHDFFLYLAYVSKFCVTLIQERTPFNEIECVAEVAAWTIYESWSLFPNYPLLQRFARVKKSTLVQELFLMNNS